MNRAEVYSQALLERSAALCAESCKRHSIPVVRLSSADLIAKKRGICGHLEVTRVFKKSTHTDPGKNFPWEKYLGLVAAKLAETATHVAPT